MTIAVSCGEPAGIGPEIAAAAWAELRDEAPLVWIGDPQHLPPGTPWQAVSSAADAPDISKTALPVLSQDFGAPRVPGDPQPGHAKGVIAAIETATHLALKGDVDAIVTAPIHKKALMDGAGFDFPGHTEFLGHLAGVDRVVMMLASDTLRVVPTTIHIPLADVPGALTPDLLAETIEITHAALIRDFGIPEPVIWVAGLNPHAGEGGKMGTEDRDIIDPITHRYHDMGWLIAGPMSADTMFLAKAREKYDAAICMYHDQALIPIKTLAFDEGVNVSLGLPFIRTSPDHGTAFDIAGKDIANPASMIAAIRMADRMAKSRT